MTKLLIAVSLIFGIGCSSDKTTDPPATDASEDLVADQQADLGGDNSDTSEDLTKDEGPQLRDCEVEFLDEGESPFQTLSEWCLFIDESGRVVNEGVHAFEVASVLFADDSSKERFFALPPNTTIDFTDDDQWGFPVGTIHVKSFYYPLNEAEPDGPRQMLETRLNVLRETGWEPYIYVWNAEQNEANFERLGLWVDVERTTDAGDNESIRYRVPNTNQCKSCHAQNDILLPLGPRTRQLNIDVDGESQLETFAQLGLFSAPLPDLSTLPSMAAPDGDGDLDARARSYLEANCAHCHNPDGAGGPSGLNLSVTVTEPVEYGICKRPVAAGAGAGGRFFDIVPGDADGSIIVFRMASVDPEIKMPELPTQTSDDFGVRLISEWIDGMTPPGCPE